MARGSRADTDPKPSKKDDGKRDDEEQSARFIETARRLGVDETGEKFERVMDKIIKPKRRGKTITLHL